MNPHQARQLALNLARFRAIIRARQFRNRVVLDRHRRSAAYRDNPLFVTIWERE